MLTNGMSHFHPNGAQISYFWGKMGAGAADMSNAPKYE